MTHAPRLRLVAGAKPAEEPTDPLDHEGRPATARAPVQGTLALTYDLPTGVPAIPERPSLRALGSGPDEELRAWAGMLAVALVEVLAGLRPLGQIARWTTHRVGQQLTKHVRSAPASRRATGRGRPRLRSVHISMVDAETAEATVVLGQEGRVRALALRLQKRRGRWVCSAFATA